MSVIFDGSTAIVNGEVVTASAEGSTVMIDGEVVFLSVDGSNVIVNGEAVPEAMPAAAVTNGVAVAATPSHSTSEANVVHNSLGGASNPLSKSIMELGDEKEDRRKRQ